MKVNTPKQMMQWIWFALLLAMTPWAWGQDAEPQYRNTLEELIFNVLPGEQVQFRLTFSEAVAEPVSFTTDDPARIAIDFAATKNGLSARQIPVGVGLASSVNAIEAMGRTRVVINLAQSVPYEMRRQDQYLYLTLGAGAGGDGTAPVAGSRARTDRFASNEIENLDFRRGEDGEGKVQIFLDSADTVVDVRREAGMTIAEVVGTQLPRELERRLDVIDFSTPVKYVDAFQSGSNVRIQVEAQGRYEQFSYQSDRVFTLEFKPVVETAETKKSEFGYTGERLSLNFQDIEVRAVLQIIAEFTGFNLVASDTVGGRITLRLRNVPWDQALDIVLKSKGLAMRKSGNVVLVAPANEVAAREKAELESKKQIEDLEPLRSEYIQINYAKAADIAALLKSSENTLMSARGSVTIDERTNTLLVQDTPSSLEQARVLINKLDVPIKQVLIESRVVVANNDFSKELGVRFGLTGVDSRGSDDLQASTGSINGTSGMVDSAISNIASTGQQYPVALPGSSDRLNFSAPAAGNAGRIAFAILNSDYLLDLELSALQAEGRGEIVSSPRVVTSDQTQARVEQGVEIPYESAADGGGSNTEFKKAVLSLTVTPQVTPDDRVIMDLQITKDNPNATGGVDTRQITTNVLVDNGDTVVLGGVHETTKSESTSKVPFFGDLPLLGALFRNNFVEDRQNELLIFVTPKILKDSLKM